MDTKVADNALQVVPESVQAAMDVLCPQDKLKAVMKIDAYIERLRSAEREADDRRDQACRKLEEIKKRAIDEELGKIKHIDKEQYRRAHHWSSQEPNIYRFDLIQSGQIPASIAPMAKKFHAKKGSAKLKKDIETKIRTSMGIEGDVYFGANGSWRTKECLSLSIDLSKNDEFNEAKMEFDSVNAECKANEKISDEFYKKLRMISIGMRFAY